MRDLDAKRFAAPAAFLLAVTVAVIVARAGLHHGSASSTQQTIPPPIRRHVVTTTTRAKPKHGPAAGARVYTVAAGDTFGVISTKTGVAAARIQQLNPKVQSTALFIGQKLRIR